MRGGEQTCGESCRCPSTSSVIALRTALNSVKQNRVTGLKSMKECRRYALQWRIEGMTSGVALASSHIWSMQSAQASRPQSRHIHEHAKIEVMHESENHRRSISYT